MSRLVLDRLWPMLVGLAALLVGAAVLEHWAAARGNEPLVIAISGDAPSADDEDGATVDDGDAPEEAPISDAHAHARVAAHRALYAQAIPLYEQVLAASPNEPAVEAELGGVLLAAGDPRRALPHLEHADALRPGFVSALRLGIARANLGDLPAAEQDLRRAVALRPASGSARITLGSVLRRRGAVDEAVKVLAEAAASGSNEDRARALVALGAAQLAAGRRAEASAAFERAIEYAPARAEIRLGVARAWLSTDAKEDAARALSVLSRAAELAPDLPAVFGALGRARERAGDSTGAAEAYEHALRLDPSDRYARRRVLRLALQARDFARARHEAERLVADGPDVPEHHFLAGLVADRDDRADDARAAYRKAIALAKDDYPEAWLNLGNLEKGEKRLDAAREAYRKALALRPAYLGAWLNLGKLEEAAGDPAAAEAAYRKALELDARHAPAWLALGQLQSAGGKLDDARASLRRALDARPGYDAAELSLGVAEARAGRPAEAVRAYRALLARNPRHLSAWYDLALALDAAGRPAEARDALAQAVQIDPTHAPSRRALARAELAAGRLPEAKAGFEELVDLVPGDLEARVALAEIAAREGDRAGCIARARALAAEAPRDPSVAGLPARCVAGVRSATP